MITLIASFISHIGADWPQKNGMIKAMLLAIRANTMKLFKLSTKPFRPL